MSDIERRLQAAGAQWRAHQPPSRAHHASRSRRSRWLPATAAAAVVGLALAATGLAARLGPDRAAGPARESGWEQIAPSPLPPRLRPIMAGWGDAVVIVGGRDDRPCPPNAACARGTQETLRDGAIYDLPSRAWRAVGPAPYPLDVSGSTVLGDTLYVGLTGEGAVGPRVLALDLPTGGWSELPAPPDVVGCCLRLVAAGPRLLAYYGEIGRADALDVAYAPASKSWEALPTAPFAPSFDRSMVWAGNRLVLITPPSPPSSQDREDGPPFMRAAVLQEGAWRELPSQQTVIFGATDWSWTGSRVVSATTYTADGGQTNRFGRAYPSGGYLDPVTGSWSTLPAPPAGQRKATPAAAGGRWVANGEGLVLDTASNRWLEPAAQPDAADQDAAAAWANGRLVVWGGAAGVSLSGDESSTRLLSSGAVWTPPTD